MADYKIDLLMRMQAADGLLLAPHLSLRAKKVGAALLRHLNRKTGRCDPGIARMMAATGLSKSTILRGLNELCAGNMPMVVRSVHGGSRGQNKYELILDRMAHFAYSYDERAGITKPKNTESKSRVVTPSNCHMVTPDRFQPLAPKPIEQPNRKNLGEKTDHKCQIIDRHIRRPRKQRKENLGARFESQAKARSTSRKDVGRDQAENRLINEVQKSNLIEALYGVDEKAPGAWETAIEKESRKNGKGIAYLLRQIIELGNGS